MQQQVTKRFEITEKEVREALYEYFVRKFKDNDINLPFAPEHIDLGEGFVYVSLEIKTHNEL